MPRRSRSSQVSLATRRLCCHCTRAATLRSIETRGARQSNDHCVQQQDGLDVLAHVSAICRTGDGAANVLFSTGLTKEIVPQWWGATGNGTHDDAFAIQVQLHCV
jgi:hypothetical protein